MQLQWNPDPTYGNVQRATSAAFQYRLQEWNDGRAELKVQHRGDRPSATPIKRFVYKNRNGAEGGAQRFENQHGYRDPAHHAPAEIVPFLPELPERVVHMINRVQLTVQEDAQGSPFADDASQDYATLCASVLCCVEYDCYNRTEIDNPRCAKHHETTED